MRLFLGVPIEGALREELAARLAEMARRFPMIRWTSPEQLHVTMRFFGDQGMSDLDPIKEWTSAAIADLPGGAIRIGKTGIFPHRDRMIFWAGLVDDAWLVAIGRALSGPVVNLSAERRAFQGHVTLGRFRSRDGGSVSMKHLLSAMKDLGLPDAMQEKPRLVLYESILMGGGPQYREIEAWPLEASPLA